MELFMQFGYGMMGHCRFLMRQWDDGAVVLSPRDLSARQLQTLADEVHESRGQVMLDPQIYRVSATHPRLIKHSFWPADGAPLVGAELARCLGELIALNNQLGARQMILPGSMAGRVDEDWLESQVLVLEEAQRQAIENFELVHTIALSSDALRNDGQVEKLLEAIPSWDVDGIYLVCEHPNGDYLVADPSWLANCLDIIAGVRLADKECFVGYANHQMLIAGAAGATALCSGTWMNVRMFDVAKFESNDDDEIKQRATWYYAPHLLSEYKTGFLDLAKKNGVLGKLETSPEYGSDHATELFSAPQPSLATFTEQHAFRHYLQAMRTQCLLAAKGSFGETVAALRQSLDTAERELVALHKTGIFGQQRDFYQCIDASRGALAFLEINRGPTLQRNWNSLMN